jgi:WD40 repeat protein
MKEDPAAVVPAPAGAPDWPVVRVFGEPSFQTDGDLLALAFGTAGVLSTVEEPGLLRRWDASTGRRISSQFLSDLETTWVFSPDGRALVAASDEVSVWDVARAEPITTFAPPSWVTALGVCSQPALIATGHDEGVVRLWDPAGHRLLRELAGHDRPVGALAFSPDGRRLATAGEDRVIRLWDVGAGRLHGTLGRHADRIGDVAWFPDGRRLASAAWDRTVRIWDVDSLEPLILLNTHADQVTALAVSPDGTLLASADSDRSIHVWDPVDYRELHVHRDFANDVTCLAFSPDGRRLACGGAGRAIQLRDPRQARAETVPQGMGQTAVALVGNGSGLANVCPGHGLRVWDVHAGGVRLLSERATDVIAASPDGRRLATGCGRSIHLWNPSTGNREAVLEGQRGRVAALAFAPDSTRLASASADDGMVWIWDVQIREPILVIPVGADGCTAEAVAFHPGGDLLAVAGIDWLATGGSDGAVCLWDLERRQAGAAFARGATALAFHSSGRWLAAPGLDGALRVWDLDAGRPAPWETEPTDRFGAVAYSPDGRWLAAGGDGILRIWHAPSGQLATTREPESAVKSLAFSGDGRFLFTGNADTTCCQVDFARLVAGA